MNGRLRGIIFGGIGWGMNQDQRKKQRRDDALAAFAELLDVVDTLRSENGCPWDREQTHASLKPYIEEEAYELIDAIDAGHPAHLCEELGDVMLQVMLHAQIAFEADAFSIAEVMRGLSRKMITRHPHVFAQVTADTSEEVLRNWEQIKSTEKDRKGKGLFDGIPRQLPALSRAARMGSRAARTGFDWQTPGGVREKVAEELAELDAAVASGAPEDITHELGDVLFAVSQWARHLKQDPEDALRKSCARFADRYHKMETAVSATGRAVRDCHPDELEAAWQEAKRT